MDVHPKPADPAPPKNYSHTQILRVISGIFLCMLLAALDQTAVVPAVPAIARDLHSYGHVAWIVTAYLLTRDLLNILAAIAGKKAGFRSLSDAWADTTTAHGRLMLTILGGLAEFERELIRARSGEGRKLAKARGGAADRRAVCRSLCRSGRCSVELGIVPAGEVVRLELAERLAGARQVLSNISASASHRGAFQQDIRFECPRSCIHGAKVPHLLPPSGIAPARELFSAWGRSRRSKSQSPKRIYPAA
jgi:Resolvase, N terminal domain